jgi:hypothetical protein
VINEFLASNLHASFDEDGDSEDWAEIHNRSPAPVSLAGYRLTDDSTEPGKWTFPDVSVPPNGYLLVWLSAKDRYVPPSEVIASGIAFDARLVASGETWRYLVAVPGTPGPPAGWNRTGFDDASWESGPSGFGYGDGDDRTLLPDQTSAVFTRKEFHVDDPARLANLLLRVDYDDGFVAYLNGVRVAAASAAPGDPTFDTIAAATHEAGVPERFDLTPFLGALIPGANVLAVVGLNRVPSSDMSLAVELGVAPSVLHTSFRLQKDGEELIFIAPDGIPIDWVIFSAQTEDHSYGRSPDGDGPWRYLLTPTPDAPNDTQAFSEPISAAVTVEPPAGRYASPLAVTLSAQPAAVMEIHYTMDGSEPTPAAARFTAPVPVSESTVFRVAGFIGGERATQVASYSYFVGGTVDLPILSISMAPEDYLEVHNNSAARGITSERAAYMEYFEPDGSRMASTGFGLRLHGGAGRGGDFDTKKAYKAYFRGVYGDKRLNYRLIPDTDVSEFDKLVLRSAFNDSFRTNGRATYLRDQLIRDLHEDMGAVVSHGTWCLLYVNMRLRGLFNVVERMDEVFMDSYLGGGDAWDVIKTGNEPLSGDRVEWDRLRGFIVNNDLSQPEVYAQAARLLDLESFTGYMILNMWAQNHDWPHNNWYAARPREPDARWIFLSWDGEFGIGLIPSGWTSDSLDFTLGRDGYLQDIFEGLLESPVYREHFLGELERHLSGALRPENVRARLDRLRGLVLADIPEEVALFGRSVATWEANVAEMHAFLANRGGAFRSIIERSAIFADPSGLLPLVQSVEPPVVVNTGGVVLTLRGARLLATDIALNGIPAEVVRVLAFGTGLEVRLPFLPELSGAVTIRATSQSSGGFSDAAGLLEVRLPVPEVTSVEPPFGSLEGGDLVRIRGNYFLAGVRVAFGGRDAASVVRAGGGMSELEVVTPPGAGEVSIVVTNTQPAELTALAAPSFMYAPFAFLRADMNGDLAVDISDAFSILNALFLEAPQRDCEAAADTDRSGEVDLTDPVFLLNYLFGEGPAPAAPFAGCGGAQPDEPLGCADDAACR